MEKMQLRAEKIETMKAIVDRAEKKDRGLKKHEKREIDKLETEVDKLDQEISEEKKIREKEKEEILREEGDGKTDMKLRVFKPGEEFRSSTREQSVYGNKDFSFGKYLKGIAFRSSTREQSVYGNKDFSFGKYLRGIALGDWKGAEELRELGQANATAGGYLVPEDMATRIIEKTRKQMTANRAGARTIEVPHGEISLAKILEHPDIEVKEENEEAQGTDIKFGRANLSLWTLFGICTISQELLQDGKNVGEIVENELADSLAEKSDYLAYFGTGAGQPIGLFNHEDIPEHSLGENGATLADSDYYDPWSFAIEEVRTRSNKEPVATVYNPRTAGSLERAKANGSEYLKAPDFFAGLNRYVTNQIPNDLVQGTADDASAAVVGDFSNLLYAVHPRGMEMRITETGGGALEKYQLKIAVAMRVDWLATKPDEFCIRGILPDSQAE